MTSTMVVDACALLNLTATGREVEIVRAIGLRLLVPEPARSEVKYHLVPADGGAVVKTAVDLSALEKAELLQIVSLDDCLDEFVDCCVYLQDIDASVLAFALHHGHSVISDDRRVKKVARHRYNISAQSSLGLLRMASARLNWDDELLKNVLNRVLVYANFLPPRGDDEVLQWYRSHTIG